MLTLRVNCKIWRWKACKIEKLTYSDSYKFHQNLSYIIFRPWDELKKEVADVKMAQRCPKTGTENRYLECEPHTRAGCLDRWADGEKSSQDAFDLFQNSAWTPKMRPPSAKARPPMRYTFHLYALMYSDLSQSYLHRQRRSIDRCRRAMLNENKRVSVEWPASGSKWVFPIEGAKYRRQSFARPYRRQYKQIAFWDRTLRRDSGEKVDNLRANLEVQDRRATPQIWWIVCLVLISFVSKYVTLGRKQGSNNTKGDEMK